MTNVARQVIGRVTAVTGITNAAANTGPVAGVSYDISVWLGANETNITGVKPHGRKFAADALIVAAKPGDRFIAIYDGGVVFPLIQEQYATGCEP